MVALQKLAGEAVAQSSTPSRERAPVSPFLKWAGGKSGLIAQFEPLFPRRFRRYFEPFLGSAAVFFHLQPEGALLSDLNPRLIDCYQAVREHLEAVIHHLEALRRSHCKDQYYQVRKQFNHRPDLPLAERAAIQIYLNKTCFNGLYRENRRGHFNVPVGRYRNPGIFDADNLQVVSQLLGRAEIRCEGFETVLERVSEGDFVYLDPPYHPVSDTANFTSFTRYGFTPFDQARLSDVCRVLDQRECLFMLSNSDTPLIRRLYRGFRIDRVQARRSINSKATRRGPIGELVIRNYS
jgi:DNA adenine methylase